MDNGIRVWYCRGELVHVHDIEELYQVGWKPSGTEPCKSSSFSRNAVVLLTIVYSSRVAFPNAIPAAPEPSPAAIAYLAGKKSRSPAATTGPASGTTTPIKQAYRPPGARGLAAPSIFRREDEGGSPSQTPTPSRGQTPNPGQQDHRAGMGRGGRYVPGAQRHSPSPGPHGPPGAGGPGGDKDKEKRKRNKGAKTANGTSTPITNGGGSGAGTPVVESLPPPPPPPPVPTAEETADQAALQKKIRNLNKKVRVFHRSSSGAIEADVICV